MTANLQITFRDFPPPLLAEERIREWVDRLGKLHPRITSCRIVAEAPHRHRKKGTLYRIRIDLTVPGGELVVNRDPQRQKRARGFFRRHAGRVQRHEAEAALLRPSPKRPDQIRR